MRSRLALLPLLLALGPASGMAADGSPATSPSAPESPPQAAAAATPSLPPLDCVRRVRDARIADLQGQHDRALGLLKVALRTCGDDLSAVTALLEHDEFAPLPETEVGTYREILRTRLLETSRPLPGGLLRFMVGGSDIEPEDLELMLQAAKARAGPQAERVLLEAIVHLEKRLGRPADARRTLAGMVERWDDSNLRWECIQLDYQLERWADAVPLLRREVEVLNWAPNVLAYARALIAAGDWQEAVRQLQSLVRREGPELLPSGHIVPMLVEAAWAARDAGQPAASEAAFRYALELDPQSADARAAILYLYAGPEERRTLLESARVGVTGDANPDELLNEGVRSLSAGDAEGALSLFMAVVEIDPTYEAAWFNAGLTALRLERWEDAEAALARSASLNPERLETRTLRGAALRELGRCEEAIDLLRGVVETEPGTADAWRLLANCYHDLGRAEEALEARKQAEALAPPPAP